MNKFFDKANTHSEASSSEPVLTKWTKRTRTVRGGKLEAAVMILD